MEQPGKRVVKGTHSLLVGDFKVYQESHKTLKGLKEMTVQACNVTGAYHGLAKCAEIFFAREKMVKGEGLKVLNEKMKTTEPDENKIYKFLSVEQADCIKVKEVYNRVKGELSSRMNFMIRTELNDKNLVKAINTKVITIAAYPMNVYKFTQSDLTELDQVMKINMTQVKECFKKSSEEKRFEHSSKEQMQSEIYKK